MLTHNVQTIHARHRPHTRNIQDTKKTHGMQEKYEAYNDNLTEQRLQHKAFASICIN